MLLKKYLGFLFENINHKQTILKNTFWLGVSQGFSGIVNFFLIVFIAKTLGPGEYGKFAFSFSFVSLFSTLFDFGLSTAVTREFARDSEKKKYFLDLWLLKFILGGGVLLVIFCSVFFVTADSLIRQLIILLGLYYLFTEGLNFQYAYLRSSARMEKEAVYRIVNSITTAAAVIAILFFRRNVVSLGYAYLFSTFLVFVIALSSYCFNNRNWIFPKFSINIKIWKEFLWIGWYLALAKGVGDITMNIDSVMLGCGGQIKQVGWYNAAAKINGLCLFPMAIVTSALLPSFITILNESKERFIKYWEFAMRAAIIFSFCLCFIVWSQSERIILLFYSQQYLPAVLALRIIIVMMLLVYIYSMLFHALLIFNRQKDIFYIMSLGAILNVILNYILIRKFSLYGASIATVCTHLVILILLAVFAGKFTIIKPFKVKFFLEIFVSSVAGILMYLTIFISGFGKINLLGTVLLAVLFYAVYYGGLNNLRNKIRSTCMKII
jgi:O-antigen/teichoic acid export membrane protein